MMKSPKAFLASCAFMVSAIATNSPAQSLKDADILVIGDSQILFRGGSAYVDYFTNLAATCGKIVPGRTDDLKTYLMGNVGVVGVRGASINSWLDRKGKEKDRLCVPEKTWPKNARGFGVLHNDKQKFEQLSASGTYPLCVADQSPIETLFKDVGIKPKLLVLSILGKQSEFWEMDEALAHSDAEDLAKQIPASTPCLYLTTAPNFAAHQNALRKTGQDRFFDGLSKNPGACVPVKGLNGDTIAALQGNKAFYKTGKDGKVRDGFHPNDQGIRTFLKTVTPSLCHAVLTIMDREKSASLQNENVVAEK